jgi:hypothetical protein
MNIERVLSREYKVILQAEAFEGGEKQLLKTAGDFWREFKRAVDKTIDDKDGNLDKIAKSRMIRFYDTKEHLLHRNSYLFHERREVGTEKSEVTLKFRHSDRYISQDRSMTPRDPDAGKTKFEEDIKPPFMILYSSQLPRESGPVTDAPFPTAVERRYGGQALPIFGG